MMKELKFSLADKKGTNTIVAAILGGRLFLVLMADVVRRTGHNVNHAFGIRLPKDRQILKLLKWMMKELKFCLADKKGTNTIAVAILGGRLFLVLMADVVRRTGHNVNHAFGIRLPKDRQILKLLKWMMKELKFCLADKKGTNTIAAAVLGGRLFLVLMADVVRRTGHNVNHAFGIRLPKDRQILKLLKWMMKEPKFFLVDKNGTDTIAAAILGGRLFLVLMADVVRRTGHNVNHAFGIRLPKDRQILKLLKWMMKEPKFFLVDKNGTDTIAAAILGGRLFLVLMADVVRRTGHNVNHAFGIRLPKDHQILKLLKWMMKEPKFFLVDKNGTDTIAAAILGGRLFLVLMADVVRRTGHNVNHAFGIRLPKDRQILKLLKWMMKEPKFFLVDKNGTDTIAAAILGGRLFLVLMADVVRRTGHNVNHAFGIRLPKDRQILNLVKWMMKEPKFFLVDKNGTDTIAAAILGGRLFLVLMADVVRRTGHNVNHAFGIRLPKDRQILKLLKWMMKEPKFFLVDKNGTDTIAAAILGGRLFLVLMADVVRRTGHNVNHAFGIRLPKDRQILKLLKWMMKEPKFFLVDKNGTDTIAAAILGGRLFLVLMADVVRRTGHNVNHAFGIRLPKDHQILKLLKWMMKEPKFFLVDKNGTDTIAAAILAGRLFLVLMADVVRRTGHNVNHAFGIRLPKDRQILKLLKWMMKEPKFFLVDKNGTDTIAAAILGGRLFLVLMADVVRRTGHNVNHAFGIRLPKDRQILKLLKWMMKEPKFFLVDKNGADTIAAAILGGRLFLVLMADVVRQTGHNVNHAFGIRLPKDRQILKLLKWMMKEPKFFLVDKNGTDTIAAAILGGRLFLVLMADVVRRTGHNVNHAFGIRLPKDRLVDKNGTDTIAAAILGGRLFLVLMADVVRRTGHNVNHAFGIRLPKDRQILKLLKWMMKEPKFFLVDKNGTDTIAAAILGGRLFLVLMADVVRRTGHNVNHAFGIRLPKDRQILKLLKWMMKEPKFFLVDKNGTDTIAAAILGGRLFLVLMADVVRRTGHNVNHAFGISSRNNFSHRRIGSSEVFFSWSFAVKKTMCGTWSSSCFGWSMASVECVGVVQASIFCDSLPLLSVYDARIFVWSCV